MKHAGIALVALSCAVMAAARQPDPVTVYRIDPAHSHVGFSVRHMVVSNVRGQFNDVAGTIELDERDITRSKVDVVVKTASIDTNNERRDTHLRSADFFEVERYPELRFAGKRVERAAGGLVLVGDLTIRDVTREVRIPFTLSGPVPAGQGRRRIGAEGSVTIVRQDFGLVYGAVVEAGPVVGDEVKIELEVEAVSTANP